MVELDNIHSTEGGGDIPPPDAPGPIIPAYAPDKETRAAADAKANSWSSQRLGFVNTPW